jgi:hypothetical protein
MVRGTHPTLATLLGLVRDKMVRGTHPTLAENPFKHATVFEWNDFNHSYII